MGEDITQREANAKLTVGNFKITSNAKTLDL